MGAAVEVHDLHKAYGRLAAVDGVSFDVRTGEILGILGPNGSGKTTTVECLQGLRRIDRGEVRVLGLDPRADLRELRRRVGSQLQDSALPDRIRVEEAVQLFASVGDGSADVEALLADWGLAERRRAMFGRLSGGQRQRLFIALALVRRPELVFLDEMTTGLDPAARHEAWVLVERVRDGGTTVVLVTHFMEEAERLCDRIVVLRDGRVVAAGTPADVTTEHGGGVRCEMPGGLEEAELAALPGATSVERRGQRLDVVGTAATAAYAGHLLVQRGLPVDGFRVLEPTLQDAYLNLVGQERS